LVADFVIARKHRQTLMKGWEKAMVEIVPPQLQDRIFRRDVRIQNFVNHLSRIDTLVDMMEGCAGSITHRRWLRFPGVPVDYFTTPRAVQRIPRRIRTPPLKCGSRRRKPIAQMKKTRKWLASRVRASTQNRCCASDAA